MYTAVYIHSRIQPPHHRYDLEDALEKHFSGAIAMDGGEGNATRWTIEMQILDSSREEELIPRLTEFLREQKVPNDTFLQIFAPDSFEEESSRVVKVYSTS